jgi:hypothetical protein
MFWPLRPFGAERLGAAASPQGWPPLKKKLLYQEMVSYYFLAQTFFLGGTSPQRTRSVGRGRSKCPSYHPPTLYTLSPLLKGGEGRDEGGAYTHVPCPFGALLVTLYHLKSKAFLM